MSDKAITEDLLGRLRRHYIKPGQAFAGGVFVPECGVNGTDRPQRRCDALYVGFTATSGRLLVGHEVKASRSDWLHEIDQPDKAGQWADQCHEWWVVAAPGVVQIGELPHGWGLMEPGRSKTRMAVKVKAERHAGRVPAWWAVRSIMARLDTLCAQRIVDGAQKARHAAQEEAAKRTAQLSETRLTPGQQNRLKLLAEFEEATGCTIHEYTDHWRNDLRVRPADLVAAVDLIEKLRANGGGGYNALAGVANRLEKQAKDVAAMSALVEELAKEAAPYLGQQ